MERTMNEVFKPVVVAALHKLVDTSEDPKPIKKEMKQIKNKMRKIKEKPDKLIPSEPYPRFDPRVNTCDEWTRGKTIHRNV